MSTVLVVTEDGQRMTLRTLQYRFRTAREKAGLKGDDAFRFWDLRAKAGTDKTDSQDIRAAQMQLGHNSVQMTAHYVRKRRGDKVGPTR